MNRTSSRRELGSETRYVIDNDALAGREKGGMAAAVRASSV